MTDKTELEVSERAREAAMSVMRRVREHYVGSGVSRYMIQAFANFERDILATRTPDPTPVAWMPIESAPFDTAVEIKAGSMTFLARLMPDASEDENEQSCDQWVAHIEGEYPPCWSGGACWSSNENDDRSLQPTAWRYTGASANNELIEALEWFLSGDRDVSGQALIYSGHWEEIGARLDGFRALLTRVKGDDHV